MLKCVIHQTHKGGITEHCAVFAVYMAQPEKHMLVVYYRVKDLVLIKSAVQDLH